MSKAQQDDVASGPEPADTKKVILEEAPKKNGVAPSSAEKPKPKGSFRKMMKYLQGEWWAFFWASIALLLANVGQLVIPYYVGVFIDGIASEDYDRVYRLTWQLMLIVFVSSKGLTLYRAPQSSPFLELCTITWSASALLRT